MKRNVNENGAFELLTVGLHTYSGDNRYSVEFQYPHNWRLKISNARKSDEGTYECQISTHPPRVMQVNLHINGKLEFYSNFITIAFPAGIVCVSTNELVRKLGHCYRFYTVQTVSKLKVVCGMYPRPVDGFRLIKTKQLVDSIFCYDNFNTLLRLMFEEYV